MTAGPPTLCRPTVPARRAPGRRALPIAVAALALAAAPEVRAARPMVTDDARIVDAKACQLESWLRGVDGGGTEYWALPGCNPFGSFELTLGGATLPAAAGTPRDRALQAQLKTLLRPLRDGDWGAGIAVGTLNLFPGDRGARTRDPYVYVPVSVSTAGDGWVWHLNAGATRTGGGGRELRGTWGVGFERPLRSGLSAVGETWGVQGERALWQLGLRAWLWPERVQVDATIGDAFGAAGPARWFTIGLRLLSPPFLP